jgi:glycosyltransferase involved in cell wall biosynthesis
MDKKEPSICVSVIMPVYNGERYIGEAIESLLNQSFADWELIVVDDGSTDETANIVKRMTDSRIRYVYQENHGQASALNHGLSIAQGNCITTLDADDWFPSNSLEDRVNYFLQHPEYDVVYGDGYYCDVAGNILMRFSELMPTGVVGDVYDVLIVSPFYGTGGSVMINRQVIEKSGIRYDEALIMCQDWDFIIRVAEKVTFGYVGKITINYRLHRGGKTLAMPRGLRLESHPIEIKVINSALRS